MSHQERKSKTRTVVNHASLGQAVNELFTAKAFRQVKTRKGSKWTARMLVTVTLFWVWSGCVGLKERFEQAAKLWLTLFWHVVTGFTMANSRCVC